MSEAWLFVGLFIETIPVININKITYFNLFIIVKLYHYLKEREESCPQKLLKYHTLKEIPVKVEGLKASYGKRKGLKC